MKKGVLFAVFACIIAVGIAGFGASAAAERKPFQSLEASDIVSADVQLMPPDQTVPIEDIEVLAAYLKDVVIYSQDQSYSDYDGQAVIFTLIMADGTQREIMAYNPFIVIDGMGYKTKYEPCEALNRYANRLLSQAECAAQERNRGTLEVMEHTVTEIGREALGTAVELSEEDAAFLIQILERGSWNMDGTTDCASDCAVNLGGRLLYYHSVCGTFNEPNLAELSTISAKKPDSTGKSLTLTAEDREAVNAVLEQYILLGSVIKPVE